MFSKRNNSVTTRAAIAAVMQYGQEAVRQVPPPMQPGWRTWPSKQVSKARWRAMLTRIRLYGEPPQFGDDD